MEDTHPFINNRREYGEKSYGCWGYITWAGKHIVPIWIIISSIIFIYLLFFVVETKHQIRHIRAGANITFPTNEFEGFIYGDTIFTNDEIHSGAHWLFSDTRNKTDIKLILPLATRKSFECIKFVTYDYTGHLASLNPTKQYGILAHQLFNCFPELVRNITIGKNLGQLIVNLDMLIPIIGKETQDLIQENLLQAMQLKSLETRIAMIENKP